VINGTRGPGVFLHYRGFHHMDLSKISIGQNPPYDVNVIVEIPQGSSRVKYEFDEKSGTFFVDRFLHTAMFYPGNYGFIPHTLAPDGDPVDVLILGAVTVIPGAVVRCRPVGVLHMEDESGSDEKILAVPIDSVDAFYADVHSHKDLPTALREQIDHFFSHYKDLDPGKWVRLSRWGSASEAAGLIMRAIDAQRPTRD
jgi:inorganic pyrophosphatase